MKIILPVNLVKKGQIIKKIMMLRTPFEEELEKLHNQFYAMGTEVAAQLKKAVRAFISHDRDLAKEVIENDEIVNNYAEVRPPTCPEGPASLHQSRSCPPC